MTKSQLKTKIKEIIANLSEEELEEINSTGSVGGEYMTPMAFNPKKKKKIKEEFDPSYGVSAGEIPAGEYLNTNWDSLTDKDKIKNLEDYAADFDDDLQHNFDPDDESDEANYRRKERDKAWNMAQNIKANSAAKKLAKKGGIGSSIGYRTSGKGGMYPTMFDSYNPQKQKIKEELEPKDVQQVRKIVKEIINNMFRDIWLKRNSWNRI